MAEARTCKLAIVSSNTQGSGITLVALLFKSMLDFKRFGLDGGGKEKSANTETSNQLQCKVTQTRKTGCLIWKHKAAFGQGYASADINLS